MSWSANEIAGLALKAARGAGAPPEQAAWFGRAAAMHAAKDRDAGALADALDALPQGPILDLYLAIMSLHMACGEDGVALDVIDVHCPDALVQSYLETLPYQAEAFQDAQTGWHVRLETRVPGARGSAGRGTLPDALVAQMRTLAARTFVPETDASREGGAGAGLLDND